MNILTPYQKKALDYSKHISLTANAGSGKTFVLAKRYVEIAYNENIPLKNIVAITFTDKAAGELYKKIADEIEIRRKTADSKESGKILNRMRRQLVSANISTIHSFCINILREFSNEAKLDANFIPINQREAEELINLSIEEIINAALYDAKAEDKIKYLIRFFGSRIALSKELFKLINKRRIILSLADSFYNQQEKNIAEYFRDKFEKEIQIIFEDKIENLLKIIGKINKTVNDEYRVNAIASEIIEILQTVKKSPNFTEKIIQLHLLSSKILIKSGTIRNRGYLSKSNIEKFSNDVKFIETFFNESKLLRFDYDYRYAEKKLAEFGKILLSVFQLCYKNYSDKKNERSFLDFEDILLFTQKIIKDDSVRNYISQKYNYIMIDEYQDTNELQYEIFMPILKYLEKGNLFVVGDEKQSIYMFREAELEIFNRTKTNIGQKTNKAGILQLPHSFRLAPNIALFTNLLFKNLFNNPDPLFNEVEHNDLVCSRKDLSDNGTVELLISDNDTPDLSESELIAARIIQLKDKINLSNVAILCRKRDVFAGLEQTFVQYNIPYTIVGSRGFFQKQIIYDVYNYLSFLLNSQNDVALVGILRSPFFMISDAEIFQISLLEGKTFYDKFQKYAKDHTLLSKQLSLIGKHLRISTKIEIGLLIRQILNETGYLSIIAARKNGRQEVANLNKLIFAAGKFQTESFKGLYDFVDYLKDSIKAQEDEEQAEINFNDDKVKIMTIHKAKGLEFEAVFLYKCNTSVKKDLVITKSISVDKDLGILTKTPSRTGYFEPYISAPINGLYNYISYKKHAAENKRLLYVAITRAIDYLFICADSPSKKTYDQSFIDLIKKGFNIDFDSDSFNLSGKLKFMKFDENQFREFDKIIDFKIPIIHNIKLGEDTEKLSNANSDENSFTQEFLLDEVPDRPKNEIISATKIAIFSQCPVKYQLTYQLGYNQIAKYMRIAKSNFEFQHKEDPETNMFADLRGRIIHEALENNIIKEEIKEFVNKKIEQEITLTEKNILYNNFFIEEIISDYINFIKSETYSGIIKHKNYKNEFEIYAKDNDYFLYGIIDKLIIEKEKLIIIDYKTDKLDEQYLTEKAKNYKSQLWFYAYILSKVFPNYNEFYLRLIFILHPAKIIEEKVTKSDLQKFSYKLKNRIDLIREEKFVPNLQHCKKCHFAINHQKCIMTTVN